MSGTPEAVLHPFCPDSIGRKLPVHNHNEFTPIRQEVVGTLLLDVDGTLTVPGKDYPIDEEVLDVLSEFLAKGGSLIFNTGTTLQRVERQVLTPLFRRLDAQYGEMAARKVFARGVVVQPENGSSICLNNGVYIEENELYFSWQKINEKHVPNKSKLHQILKDEFLPLHQDAFIVDDTSHERSHRDYILSVKKLKGTIELQKYIETTIMPRHPEIDWSHISIKPARTTLDFVHSESGKTYSVQWLLDTVGGFSAPIWEFGDLGDEFGRLVPTFNINRNKPNEFRKRGIPAIDANRQEVLRRNMYVIAGKGPEAKVLDKRTGKELQVVRYQDGSIVFVAKRPKSEYRRQVKRRSGDPIVILPLFLEVKGEIREVGDAGQGTAVIIQWLMENGFFSPNHEDEAKK